MQRLVLFLILLGRLASAQDTETIAPAPTAAENLRTGYRIEVSLPIRDQTADQICAQLAAIAGAVGDENQRRTTVVLDINASTDGDAGDRAGDDDAGNQGRGSQFEDALKIARCLTGRVARPLKTVAYVRGPVRGHAVLVVLACDEFVVGPGASLGDGSIDEAESDEAIALIYQSTAALRGLVPEAAVRAMADSSETLYKITELEGAERFVNGEQAQALRAEGNAWKEVQLSEAGRPAVFSTQQLRQFRWASQTINTPDELASSLGLAKIVEPDAVATELKAVTMNLRGAVSSGRVRRFRSNLAAVVDDGSTNTVFLELDSAGGDLGSSLELAIELASLRENGGGAIGFVAAEARGDAALIALACKPLYMEPSSILGGGGAASFSRSQIEELREAIDETARLSGRPAGLLVGLLDPSIEVHRYTQRRTGQIAYFAAGDLDDQELEQWTRGEKIELDEGLTASAAIQLGLAEGEAPNATAAANSAGLDGVPAPLADRSVVHAVEWLGGIPFLGTILIFIGFMTLSMEMSAPGLGVPGFVSMLCFALFFWMKVLSGTAEWLEVVLFVAGVICILIEVLIIPGVGIFGIGGLLMVITAILLTSQTFVIPDNDYQYRQTLKGMFSVIASCFGVVAGMVALRFLLPGTTLFRHLVMPGPNSDEMIEQERREHLVNYDDLLGQTGTSVTPLRPAGKARFGDLIVAVVSDGSPLSIGDQVRVVSVQGNRIVVEEIE